MKQIKYESGKVLVYVEPLAQNGFERLETISPLDIKSSVMVLKDSKGSTIETIDVLDWHSVLLR